MDRRIGTESDPDSDAAAVVLSTNVSEAHTLRSSSFGYGRAPSCLFREPNRRNPTSMKSHQHSGECTRGFGSSEICLAGIGGFGVKASECQTTDTERVSVKGERDMTGR